MNIEFEGRNALVDTGDIAFTFESAENPREFDIGQGLDGD